MTKALPFLPFLFALIFFSCRPAPPDIMTVTGPESIKDMGKTLHHEHILVDFIGADSTGFHRWNRDEVLEKVLPYLIAIRDMGFHTFMECTPAYLGRDPELLKILSEKTGINFVTNTGLYSAYDGKFIPDSLKKKTAKELADIWIDEARNGIGGTGILPGFIKISVERGPLNPLNRKVVEAACITHLETGLPIMSHTGPAVAAFEQLEILKKYGISPKAFIWAHANEEQDWEKLLAAAKSGVFIGFDKYTPEQTQKFVDFILYMKKHGQLPKVLISHDAGWYKPGEPGGGEFRGFTDIQDYLIPALEAEGMAQFDIHQLLIRSPGKAFAIYKRIVQTE